MHLKALISDSAEPTDREMLEGAARCHAFDTAADVLRIHYGRRYVHLDARAGQLSVHLPARDQASGPLGHLGAMIGQIAAA